jgi:sulfite oxidase
VKWLQRVGFLHRSFDGFFQRERYVFERPGKGDFQEPVERIRPKSMILAPRDGVVVSAGRHVVEGVAWAGERAIAAVSVSADGGATWQAAEFRSGPQPYVWTHWQVELEFAPGDHSLIARAVDDRGEPQRLEEDWNYRGYANSAAQRVRVRVR